MQVIRKDRIELVPYHLPNSEGKTIGTADKEEEG